MMLDQVLMGEATTPAEFEDYLTEFDRDWYIGLEKEEEWKTSVLNSVPNLFSLGHNKAQVIFTDIEFCPKVSYLSIHMCRFNCSFHM